MLSRNLAVAKKKKQHKQTNKKKQTCFQGPFDPAENGHAINS